jgi:hypothetical protein
VVTPRAKARRKQKVGDKRQQQWPWQDFVNTGVKGKESEV